MKFPANIHKELKNYIYALYDPAENSELPFYVGRGVGDRVFSHLKESHNDEVQKTVYKIRELKMEPSVKILIHGLSPAEAKAAETASIAILGKDNLANKVNTNEISQHDASVKIGSELCDKYVKPALKKNKNNKNKKNKIKTKQNLQ